VELLHHLGNGFLVGVLHTFVDISQDVQFRPNDLQTFECSHCKEFGGEEGDVRIVI